MHRRTLLAALVSGASLSGCVSGRGDQPTDSPASISTKHKTATSVRRTADGIAATFRVVDSHAPTDDTASASFNGSEVLVQGTMDPSGCNRPTLDTIRYNAADGVIHLKIGGKSPYGETATVECGNASYDYRCRLTVDQSQPEAVEVVHDYAGKQIRSFLLEA